MNAFCRRIYSNCFKKECLSKFHENPSILQKTAKNMFWGPGSGLISWKCLEWRLCGQSLFYGNSQTRKEQQSLWPKNLEQTKIASIFEWPPDDAVNICNILGQGWVWWRVSGVGALQQRRGAHFHYHTEKVLITGPARSIWLMTTTF